MFSLFKMLLSLIAVIRYLKTNDEIILKEQVNTKLIFTVEDKELVAAYKNFNKHVKERLKRSRAKGKNVCEYSSIHKCQIADTYRYFNNTCAFSNKNLTFDILVTTYSLEIKFNIMILLHKIQLSYNKSR